MIHLHTTAADVRLVRFAVSPLLETVMSLRALNAAQSGTHMHRAWRDRVTPALDDLGAETLALLTALVRPQGYIPDFLSSTPARRWASFAQELAGVASSEPGSVADELRHLASHPMAQNGPGRPARQRLLHDLAARSDAGLAPVTSALSAYHRAVIAPDWPRVRSLLQDDIAYRLQALAGGGIEAMMRDLHPSVTFAADTVHIVKYYEGHTNLGGRGLVLMPSAFAWPDVIVRTAEPHAPRLSYSPRGVGRLWETKEGQAAAPLADVIGRTRAALLAQLDLPMSTTQAATQLGLSAPTLSVHLQVMRRAGLLTSFRDGRRMLHARSDLGQQLLAAAAASDRATDINGHDKDE